MIAVALVCGLGAAVGMQRMTARPGAAKVATRGVLYASADVQRGETLREASVEVRQVPVDQVPPGSLEKAADAIERVAHFPMLKGDVISDAKLAPKGAGSGMAALIRPGMRAFTILAQSVSSSLAGFLLPGNRVDVLLTRTNGGGMDSESGGASTILLLQNAEILAVHTNVDSPANNKIDPNEVRSVTLQVSPDDAAKLDLGQNSGTLHLSLRNPTDSGDSQVKPALLADLAGGAGKVAKPSPAPVVAAPPPPPAPPVPPPPAFDEVVLPVRTLRGTAMGTDRVTIRVPSRRVASRGQAAPAESRPEDLPW